MFQHINIFGRQINERGQQIAALQRKVPSARVAADDGSLIDVAFAAKESGEKQRMRVFLPPRFPSDKPVLQLMQKTTHPSVDKYNQVHVEYLTNWKPSHSLADLVAQVVDLLETGQVGQPAFEEDGQVNEPVFHEDGHVDEPKEPDEPYRTPMPDIPDTFEEVEKLTEEEARRLCEDPVAFEDFMMALPAVTSMRELRESLRHSNESLAKEILADRENFQTARAEALAVRAQLVESIDAAQVLEKQAYDLVPADAKKDAIQRELASADQADERSETISDDLRAKKIDLASWHTAYAATRLEYHTHAALAHVYQRT